jgi:ABC-type transport system involved in multi-copper enzyme maturation permease subunit
MRHIATITWLTFHEAWRRWMVLIAVLLGAAFVILYGLGFALVNDDLHRRFPLERALFPRAHNFMLLAGLYVIHFLTVMLAVFASVDTVSGEINSHTIQTIVTKPIRRWQVLLGKWLGPAAMLVIYLSLLGGGLLLITRAVSGYVPNNPVEALALIVLQALVLLSLSLLGGTRLSTLSNGIALLMLYGLTFIGTWVEQIGAILQSDTAVRIGTFSSFLLPVEALWRRAAYLMQPSVDLTSFVSPFAAFSVPNADVVLYALAYSAVAVLLALISFSRRDL